MSEIQNDRLVSEIRSQREELSQLLQQIETDSRWRYNAEFCATGLRRVERRLREIRRRGLKKSSCFSVKSL